MTDVGIIAEGYFIPPDENHFSATETTQVPLVTVDDVVETRGIVPTHLKIDVEGSELDVIRGAEATLSIGRPLLFLELHCALISARGEDPMEVIDTLTGFDYSVPVTQQDILTATVIRLLATPNPLEGAHSVKSRAGRSR